MINDIYYKSPSTGNFGATRTASQTNGPQQNYNYHYRFEDNGNIYLPSQVFRAADAPYWKKEAQVMSPYNQPVAAYEQQATQAPGFFNDIQEQQEFYRFHEAQKMPPYDRPAATYELQGSPAPHYFNDVQKQAGADLIHDYLGFPVDMDLNSVNDLYNSLDAHQQMVPTTAVSSLTAGTAPCGSPAFVGFFSQNAQLEPPDSAPFFVHPEFEASIAEMLGNRACW